MRTLLVLTAIAMAMLGNSCDLRSETAKKGMEKYVSSPTPTFAPQPSPTPVDPADIIQVDTSVESETISINTSNRKETAACRKYERVTVNGDSNTVTISGACRQVTINGDANKVTVDAATEIVFNGSSNEVRYSRFPNGKEPSIIQNRPGNTVEKVAAGSSKKGARQ